MIDQLKNIVGENAIIAGGEQLAEYGIAGKMPLSLVFPTTVEQISKIMKLARRLKKTIAIFGNNSQCNFGAAIEPFDLALSLHRMNKILSHEVADLTVTVEAGLNLATLQKSLKSKKQFLPLDPILFEHRTLGGIVAANSAGPLRFTYGVCRDLVLGMKVVLPDGAVIRVGGKTVKNVAGYDLSKMFIGAMGTLGVITELTFKLFPLPGASQTMVAGFDSFEKIPAIFRKLHSSKLVIHRCEYVNHTFVQQRMGDTIKFFAPHYFIVTIMGHPAMVATTAQKLHDLLHDAGTMRIQDFDGKNETKFWDRINQGYGKDTRLHLQLSVPRSHLNNVVTFVETISSEQQSPIAIQSHAGNGIIDLLWHGAIDESLDRIENWKATIRSLRQLVENYGGSLIVCHAPLELRRPELIWGEPGKRFSLMNSIKTKYDPHQIIAAGRFVGGL